MFVLCVSGFTYVQIDSSAQHALTVFSRLECIRVCVFLCGVQAFRLVVKTHSGGFYANV